MATRKLSYEFVQGFIADEGFKLVSEIYQNSNTKLEIMCPKGHVNDTRFSDFKSGTRCPRCSGKGRYTEKDVRKIVEEAGYTYLESKYKNSHSYINTICPEGHPYSVKFYTFNNRGDRCGECGNAKRALSNTFTYNEVVEKVSKEGYRLLSKTYTNSSNKVTIECDRGHKFDMPLKSFNSGQRCPKCRSSRGENTVRFILSGILSDDIVVEERRRVEFEGNRYYYDFYLSIGQGVYIEYDGEPHTNTEHIWYNRVRGNYEDYDREKDAYVESIGAEIIRIPHTLSKREIYEHLIERVSELTICTELTSKDLERAEYFTGHNYTENDVAEHYLYHRCRDTAQEYSVFDLTVRNYFRNVYGMTKTQYINELEEANHSPAKIATIPKYNRTAALDKP